MTSNAARNAAISRRTTETRIDLDLNLDEAGTITLHTGIGFLDHMLYVLAFHAGWSLSVTVDGDLHVDDHHSAEDTGIALGMALNDALGDRNGIARFGWAYAPLDESLSRAVVDLTTRSYTHCRLELHRERIGDLSCENIPHLLTSLIVNGRFTGHIDVIRGGNDHHRAESAVKALALALRQAAAVVAPGRIPSTKEAM